MRFLLGDWAMLDAPDGEPALQHEEEVVGLVVLVPDELTFDLHDHEVVAVESPDGARLPMPGEAGELLGEVDRLHG
jgi:hypothetical protein